MLRARRFESNLLAVISRIIRYIAFEAAYSTFGSLLVVAIRLRVVGERLTPVLQAPRACMAGVHTKRRK